MYEWQQSPIYSREDGSYIITYNNNPYHVPQEGGWMDGTEEVQWPDVHAWALAHPEQVEEEPLPPEPSPEEQARMAVQAIQAEYTRVLEQMNAACLAAERDKMTDNMAAIQADIQTLRAEMNDKIQAAEARALGLKAMRVGLTGNISTIRGRWCSCGQAMRNLGEGKLRCPACGFTLYTDTVA